MSKVSLRFKKKTNDGPKVRASSFHITAIITRGDLVGRIIRPETETEIEDKA